MTPELRTAIEMTEREYFSPAQRAARNLTTKAEAPVCVVCGRDLWRALWQGGKALYTLDGERLGGVPRLANTKEPRCFQRVRCWLRAHPDKFWQDALKALGKEAKAK